MARDVCPSADLNESLGAANQRWKKVYVGEVVEEESNFISRLVTKLASKAAISVSSLSKESIFYRLLSYALDASGVEYNFNNASAWYICFGDLLGGLIIQGGASYTNADYKTWVTLPVSLNNTNYRLAIIGENASDDNLTRDLQFVQKVEYQFLAKSVNQTNVVFDWLAIGR